MNRFSFLIGLAFGFLIAATRLNDYDVIHNALMLREFDMFLLMFSAIAVALPTIWLLERRRWVTPLGGPLQPQRSPVERKHLLGGAVFGGGWAIAGTCPGPAIAMIAGGSVLGIPVLAGIVVGLFLREYVSRRQPAPQPDRDAHVPAVAAHD